jgi:hypothetical protein
MGRHMVRLDQKDEAMRSTKDRPAQRFDRARGTIISKKLQKIVTDIEESGYANLTRLTVLKKWFETPNRLRSFGIFIAIEASRRTRETTKEEAELFCEAKEIFEDADVFETNIPRAGATRLQARLKAFQNERRESQWTSLRIIKNMNLFLVESGILLYLSHGKSPVDGYHLAANYCEHYDPRYGNGLNGPSVKRIEEIAGFVLEMEAHEEKKSKSSSQNS